MLRKLTRLTRLSCNAWTVARPVGVNPTIRVESSLHAKRYRELIAERQAETLTAAALEELRSLTDQAEKVLRPPVASRMDERDVLLRDRVRCSCPGVFAVVAALTCKGQVVERGFAASNDRNDMFHREVMGGEAFLTPAVLAQPSGALTDDSLLAAGDATPRHSTGEGSMPSSVMRSVRGRPRSWARLTRCAIRYAWT